MPPTPVRRLTRLRVPQPPLPAHLSPHDPKVSPWKLSQRLSARHFSVVCFGSDHTTHMQLLGKWACAGSTTRQLRDSIGRTLRRVTDFLHVPWNKFLVETSGDANAHATALALRAIELENFNEIWTPPGCDVLQSLTIKYPEHSVCLKAAYRGQTRLDGQSRTEKGGAGIEIALLHDNIWVTVYPCQLYLGRCRKTLDAEMQACGCALLALFSLFSSLCPT